MRWPLDDAESSFVSALSHGAIVWALRWLTGGGGWEDGERCKALEAVLDLVCRAAKCEQGARATAKWGWPRGSSRYPTAWENRI
jgi:hypothetical protein